MQIRFTDEKRENLVKRSHLGQPGTFHEFEDKMKL